MNINRKWSLRIEGVFLMAAILWISDPPVLSWRKFALFLAVTVINSIAETYREHLPK